ncbi:uncharacterized protein LOC114262652 [Camellia sinensis]|uniref:uncharacterized protein LOC114262652 n=1 Tax=Camellia sinensis TaxID=4442 RepID=UPI001036EEB5|nr:uncharacterized protein LOC114262652 [Camellia sinensis]
MTGEIWEVGLDVIRTDGALVFYESEANQTKLWNILAIYAWVDNSIGYVQDTFWCFERAMRRLVRIYFHYQRENFKSNAHSIGVQSQLSTLAGIMKAVDPKLHQHLGMADPARRKQ